jgi:hypothetical protein
MIAYIQKQYFVSFPEFPIFDDFMGSIEETTPPLRSIGGH